MRMHRPYPLCIVRSTTLQVRLVVFGRQGAGKGTQCELLAERFQVPHISTGDMLRAALAEETPVGLEAKPYMDAGELLPDNVMIRLVDERLSAADTENGFLLDGFPRSLAQAEAILELLGDRIDAAIDIDVPLDVVMERMIARGRTDDTPEAIATRLNLYSQTTVPAIERFDGAGLLRRVDGLGTVEEVFERVVAAIEG